MQTAPFWHGSDAQGSVSSLQMGPSNPGALRAGQRQQELVQPVMDRINEVIEEIREEGSYAIIFDVAGGGVVAADSALDLTQEVIRRLQASGETAGATGRN